MSGLRNSRLSNGQQRRRLEPLYVPLKLGQASLFAADLEYTIPGLDKGPIPMRNSLQHGFQALSKVLEGLGRSVLIIQLTYYSLKPYAVPDRSLPLPSL